MSRGCEVKRSSGEALALDIGQAHCRLESDEEIKIVMLFERISS